MEKKKRTRDERLIGRGEGREGPETVLVEKDKEMMMTDRSRNGLKRVEA